MDSHKDYRAVIAAAQLLESAASGSWHFLLVGSGADRAALIADAQALSERQAPSHSETLAWRQSKPSGQRRSAY